MKTADIENAANRQSRRCCVGIPMDEDRNMNTRMVQRHRRCANIPMNTS
ncbi:MAG: tetrahydrofolate synthase, partial [Prevotella salivae]|nr:tetrahydrofolate synthase [Segatella salivae]